ncbi:MAG: anaerobic sulfatase maturase [Armatimonadetes bacterium]|nr:anaerobic sulfatase maturase [Armatimonadota bacterium]
MASAFVPKAQIETGDDWRRRMPAAFHVMLKPTGAACNLDCQYCFYLRKEALYPGVSSRMSEEVLEAFTREYLQAQCVPEVHFTWQGGEPTLLGLDFFRRAVQLQRQYARPDVTVYNALQTNGVLLDDEWCRFLKENCFLVGLSLDGPKDLHDAYRVDKRGRATFDKVYRALKLLQKHKVEYNVLCVVNRLNSQHPLRVYRFFRREGVRFIQFIPAVEPTPEGGVTEWTVPSQAWGEFLCAVFDEWVRRDVGRVFVQHFDVALEAWLGMEPSLCVHARTCGGCLAMERNGDLFSCDHYVSPHYFLGNIREMPLAQMVASPFQRQFGRDKWERLPRYCRECEVLFVCHGGCPKDRFAHTPDGEEGLNYLCEGYKRFFTHIAPYMREMARLIRAGQPASRIMERISPSPLIEGTV